MASVFKRKKDRERDKRGGKRSKWIAQWKDHEQGRMRTRVACTDKKEAMKLAEKWEAESLARANNLPLDDDRRHLQPLQELLPEFTKARLDRGTSKRRIEQAGNRILRLLEDIDAKVLPDLNRQSVRNSLRRVKNAKTGKALSDTSRNLYLADLKQFVKWIVEEKELPSTLDKVAGIEAIPKKNIEHVHPRRSSSADELGKLLAATLERPLMEAMTVRRGKNKGKRLAKISKRTREKKQRLGRERCVCYLIAYWAGLRRSEIMQLRWSHVHLEAKIPHFSLPKEITKGKREAHQPLHGQLAEALKQWKAENGGKEGRVVSTVPSMKAYKADLELAGIPYGDKEMGYADLHAMRKSIGTHMAVEGLTPRVRQAHMRHTDPRLTEGTYMEERLLPINRELQRMSPLPIGRICIESPAAGEGSGQRAANAQFTGDAEGHVEAGSGTEGEEAEAELIVSLARSYPLLVARCCANWQGPASSDTGPL